MSSPPKRPRSVLELAHGWMPFGLGQTKPHHFREMLRIAWENKDKPRYAWKVLTQGVCDGCALGTTGVRDWTMDGIHLCMVRLELLRLNTMPAFDPARLSDAASLRRSGSRALREMGRLAWPMRRRRGEPGFSRVSWDELWAEVGARWKAAPPERTAMYLTSRGITNEVYYVAQKVMRYLGSNNVDNSARLCHSPSTTALKGAIGVAATTCSYRDLFDADLIVLFGSNPANDQPVAMKYLQEAKTRGARVIMVNAYREPGMERYWIPSSPASALFGTRIADRFHLVRVGGDLAFLNAVQKILVERGWIRRPFIESATTGFDALAASLRAQPMEQLLEACGLPIEEVEGFARAIADADLAILIWSMGITQHENGTDTVRAIANLGLMREMVGRPGTGLMPIRGHSGVQGGAEMGAYATAFPGGIPIEPDAARRLSALWGFSVPDAPGLTTVEALEAAGCGELEALYAIGGNFLETMPSPDRIEAAIGRIPLRVHADICVTTQMLVEPAQTVYLVPSRTRYEQAGGGTETSTERRVIFSPEIPGHAPGETRSEWELLLDLARAVKPETYAKVHFDSAAAIRREIARAVPAYAGIEKLARQGDQFQMGGARLCENGRFPTEDGKAHFQPVTATGRGATLAAARGDTLAAARRFTLSTRRGKQFNSMVQRDRDPLTGARREDIFIARSDAKRLGIAHGAPLTLRSPSGRFSGRAFFADVAPGTLQGHWPEVSGLIPHGHVDAGGGVPDYNALVVIEG